MVFGTHNENGDNPFRGFDVCSFDVILSIANAIPVATPTVHKMYHFQKYPFVPLRALMGRNFTSFGWGPLFKGLSYIRNQVQQGPLNNASHISGLLADTLLGSRCRYVDKVLDAARRELAMECDYVREAQCGRIFSALLRDQPQLYCPTVYDKLSTARVLTTELVRSGTICSAIRLLCLP